MLFSYSTHKVIPIEQGLKQPLAQSKVRASTPHKDHSTTTRIETRRYKNLSRPGLASTEVSNRTRIETSQTPYPEWSSSLLYRGIPIEQGLKHRSFMEAFVPLGPHKVIPIEQGLKLATLYP